MKTRVVSVKEGDVVKILKSEGIHPSWYEDNKMSKRRFVVKSVNEVAIENGRGEELRGYKGFAELQLISEDSPEEDFGYSINNRQIKKLAA